MIYQVRNRTRLEDIVYAINLYFDGLSLRKTSKALSRFVNRSHTAIRDWIQKYKPQRLLSKLSKIQRLVSRFPPFMAMGRGFKSLRPLSC